MPTKQLKAMWTWNRRLATVLPVFPLLSRGVTVKRGVEYAYVHVHSLKLDIMWDKRQQVCFPHSCLHPAWLGWK